MNLDSDIVTIRPQSRVGTLQDLPNYVGISSATAGATGISMNIVIIPPGARARPHYHEGFETAIYLLKGRVETRYGKGLSKSVVNTAGDFIFIPPGVPHQPVNLSPDTEAIALVSRNDPDEQESVKPYADELQEASLSIPERSPSE
jgi:uncharacterized RmlC-like cupin family protein